MTRSRDRVHCPDTAANQGGRSIPASYSLPHAPDGREIAGAVRGGRISTGADGSCSRRKVRAMNAIHRRPASPLPPGLPAPGFRLRSTPEQTVAPSDFAGRPVILAFYPADWSPSAATRWRSTRRSCRSSKSTTRSCSAFPSTASGAIWRSPETARSAFRCSRTSSPRARCRAAYQRLPRGRRLQRAGAVRARPRRIGLLELPLAGRRQSRRRRHPARAREHGKRRRAHET